ncbi:HAD hydrolase family protein, partial [Bacillus altitudinis]|uniref:HAD hydrolase family protein n=1 Tax=Bacillus altitudinis TaxID=293387 RepID=UPI003B51809C
MKITLHDPQPNCLQTKHKLKQFFQQLYILPSHHTSIHISNIPLHKPTTLKHLQNILTLTQHQTIVFPHRPNHLQLIPPPHYTFPLTNPTHQVNDAPHFITLSNQHTPLMHT